jgi:hypothetical protein
MNDAPAKLAILGRIDRLPADLRAIIISAANSRPQSRERRFTSIIESGRLKGVSESQLRLLMGLYARADFQTGICFASHQSLAEPVGLGDRWVGKNLEQLRDAGCIEILFSGGGGRGRPPIIRLSFIAGKVTQLCHLSDEQKPDASVTYSDQDTRRAPAEKVTRDPSDTRHSCVALTNSNNQIGTNTNTEECNELASPASSPPAPPLMLFECVGGRNSTDRQWKLTQQFVDELQSQFPAVDVMAQCRLALGWTKNNPERRKTATGMPNFLWRWMNREQDKGRHPTRTEERPERRGRQLERESNSRFQLPDFSDLCEPDANSINRVSAKRAA